LRKFSHILYCLMVYVSLPAQTLTPASVQSDSSALVDTLHSRTAVAATYSFINLQQNKLHYGKDSSVFMGLFKKIESLQNIRKGRFTIVHIGGSHVQAGIWSHAFYKNFPANFHGATAGYFVFPYKMAKTNGQPYASSFCQGKWTKCRNVRKDFCLPLGMNGWSVSTNDSSAFFGVTLTARAELKKFNTVKVYHNFNPSFELYSMHKAEKADYKEQGYTLFTFDHEMDSICLTAVKIDTLQKDFTLFGFSLEDSNITGYYLAALGANGASTNSYLRCDYFVPQLQTIQPDLVFLSLGVNDVQAKDFTMEGFMASYDSLINMIRKAAPDCGIVITTTTDNFIKRKTPNIRSEKARQAAFALMEKRNIAVWDMYEVMGGYKSIAKWAKAGIAAKDRVHLSGKGYRMMGDLMFDAFYQSYLYNLNIRN